MTYLLEWGTMSVPQSAGVKRLDTRTKTGFAHGFSTVYWKRRTAQNLVENLPKQISDLSNPKQISQIRSAGG